MDYLTLPSLIDNSSLPQHTTHISFTHTISILLEVAIPTSLHTHPHTYPSSDIQDQISSIVVHHYLSVAGYGVPHVGNALQQAASETQDHEDPILHVLTLHCQLL